MCINRLRIVKHKYDVLMLFCYYGIFRLCNFNDSICKTKGDTIFEPLVALYLLLPQLQQPKQQLPSLLF